MNKKIALAVAALGLGFSINASANWHSQCQMAPYYANLYCNGEMDIQQCEYWVRIVQGCGFELEI